MKILLPWTTPPVHANQRHHWSEAWLARRDARNTTTWLIHSHRIPPQPHITVGLQWAPPTNRRRDGGENLAPLLKACIDGIVNARVVPDDTPDYVTRLMPELLPVDKENPGMWLTITWEES